MDKIRQTSATKVNGKTVKYKQGDCLSIKCGNGTFLGAFISAKFNKYYDLTLIHFNKENKPILSDFTDGKFFGTRFGSWDMLSFAVDKKMMECKYVDSNNDIQLVGNIKLLPNLGKASYSYINDIPELLEQYLEELPIRLEKTKNAEKFPDLAFVNRHLIFLSSIVTT